MNKDHKNGTCPLLATLSLLNKVHTLGIIYTLRNGELGFNSLAEGLRVNTATLSKRLHELQESKIIEKTQCENDQRQNFYKLSKKGKKISDIIEQLAKV